MFHHVSDTMAQINHAAEAVQRPQPPEVETDNHYVPLQQSDRLWLGRWTNRLVCRIHPGQSRKGNADDTNQAQPPDKRFYRRGRPTTG